MKKAYLISTGTELLLGQTVDSNSMYLATELAKMGVKVVGKSIVGDNRETMSAAFATGLDLADMVVTSGGLGPTRDDLTKEVVCQALGCELELLKEELQQIEEFFARRHRKMADCNRKQAMFPVGAKVLKNRLGTAPGMYLAQAGKIIILLPGPPREMQDMFIKEAKPLLEQEEDLVQSGSPSRLIKVFGPGESQVEEILKGVQADLALLANWGEIHIKVNFDSLYQDGNKSEFEGVCTSIEGLLGRNVFGYDEDTLAGVVARQLQQQGLSLAVVESCTGGLLSKMITDLPGSSNYFWGGVVSYSNTAKQSLLGVKEETLKACGAVSSETAAEMALGLQKISGADVAVSITGIAGPDGGSQDKPVGLVYLGIVTPQGITVKEVHFVGDRRAIRTLAAKSALDMVRRRLLPEEVRS